MLEEVFENFNWEWCVKSKLFVTLDHLHKGCWSKVLIVTNNSNLGGTTKSDKNQSNCNCFIYCFANSFIAVCVPLAYYHVHQILVYHNVLVTKPIDPMRDQSLCCSMCAHCNCWGSHYCVGPRVGVHNIVDRTYHNKPITPTPPIACVPLPHVNNPQCYLVWFAQSFHLVTYTVGPKRRVLYPCTNSLCFEMGPKFSSCFCFFLWWADKIG